MNQDEPEPRSHPHPAQPRRNTSIYDHARSTAIHFTTYYHITFKSTLKHYIIIEESTLKVMDNAIHSALSHNGQNAFSDSLEPFIKNSHTSLG